MRPSIGQKMGWVFFVVLLVAAANIVVVKQMLNDLNDVAATLNVAGKLRMLSQRIAFETVSLSSAKSAEHDSVSERPPGFRSGAGCLVAGRQRVWL